MPRALWWGWAIAESRWKRPRPSRAAPRQMPCNDTANPTGTDKTAMDFRRRLPEIRWQSCLSPVLETGSPHLLRKNARLRVILSFRARGSDLRNRAGRGGRVVFTRPKEWQYAASTLFRGALAGGKLSAHRRATPRRPYLQPFRHPARVAPVARPRLAGKHVRPVLRGSAGGGSGPRHLPSPFSPRRLVCTSTNSG